MTSWVKLHTSILGDPKLMRACREGYAGLADLPWLFVFARRAEDHGRLSVGGVAADPEDLIEGIPDRRVTVETIRQTVASCRAIGVLVEEPDGVLRFAKWDDRQAKPSDSKERIKERVRQHRARKNLTVTPGNKSMKRVTGVTRVTPRNATEEKRREENRCTTELGKSPSGISPSKGDASRASETAAGALSAPQPVIPMTADELAERDRILAEARQLQGREREGASA